MQVLNYSYSACNTTHNLLRTHAERTENHMIHDASTQSSDNIIMIISNESMLCMGVYSSYIHIEHEHFNIVVNEFAAELCVYYN